MSAEGKLRRAIVTYPSNLIGGLACLLVCACSSSRPTAVDGTGGSFASGDAGTHDGLPLPDGSVATGGVQGSDGGAGAQGGEAGPPVAGFWCSGYRESANEEGWVQVHVIIQTSDSGGMTSPIKSCQVGAGDWSVFASGIEADGVDETTMSFKIAGTYNGPGIYQGTLAQGISASLSHSDLGKAAFSSVPSSDCEICINQDGLSGTVSCWGLETPAGGALGIAHIDSGSFKCPGAQPKPAQAPTDPLPRASVGGIPSGAVVCHYLEKLDCPGRPAKDTCVQKSDSEVLTGSCYGPWEQWLACANLQSPSDYRCGMGSDLVMASGACSTELAAERTCREAVDVMKSPECDALCAKAMSVCGAECQRQTFCEPYGTHCAAAKLPWLRCAVSEGVVTCGTTGTPSYVVLGCSYDDSVCN